MDFKIIDVIASGGFGRVERICTKAGATLARKVFDPAPIVLAGSDIEKLRKRFRREVMTQQLLPKELFVEVIDHDLDIPEPWFAMPLATENYAAHIQKMKKAKLVDAESLSHILDSLEALHNLGYVHRDLKPDNILFVENRWKLSDFGLVLPPSGATTKLTSVDSSWGTAQYCAPEQADEFSHVGPPADIYSFGCILHDIVSDGRRIPYQQIRCGTNLGLIIERCTATQPAKRFKSTSNLRGVLFAVLSKPLDIGAASAKGTEWAQRLDDASTFTPENVIELSRFVSLTEDYADRRAVWDALDEDAIADLHALNPDYWQQLVHSYCEWAEDGGFDFTYCDVIALRLGKIFHTGDVETKARAALAAAELGFSHNRWFVMGRVLDMCGPSLDERVADRLAIEIQVEEKELQFRRCALAIGRDPASSYHAKISDVIPEPSATESEIGALF